MASKLILSSLRTVLKLRLAGFRAGCPSGPGRNASAQVYLQVALAGNSLSRDDAACFWLPWQTVQQVFWPNNSMVSSEQCRWLSLKHSTAGAG